MAGLRPNTSISSFLVGPNSSAWRVMACQVMPLTCIVYSFLPLVERVGARFAPVHMVPAPEVWCELLRTPLWRSSRQRESLHSYTQIVLGTPDEGYSVITTARPS